MIPTPSLDEITQTGQNIYDTKLKQILEKDHKGEFVAIEIESEDYFLGTTLDEALLKAKEKYPDKIFHSVKIGSTGLYTVSSYKPSAYGNFRLS